MHVSDLAMMRIAALDAVDRGEYDKARRLEDSLRNAGRADLADEVYVAGLEHARAARLEYLRGEIESERISYGEIAELQDLAEHIDPDDVQLLEWAGVPEDLEERARFFADRKVETRG